MATSPALRRSEHRMELRALILETARELFVSEGFEGFSMRKLAGRVGYSAASIYQHFASRDVLFQCLVEESFKALVEAQAKAAVGGPAEPLQDLARGLRTYVQFGLEHPHEYRFAFLMPSSSRRAEDAVKAFDSLRNRVKACIDAGFFRPMDAEVAAQILWSAVHGVTSLLIVKPGFPWVNREELIEQLIQNVMQGMMPAA